LPKFLRYATFFQIPFLALQAPAAINVALGCKLPYDVFTPVRSKSGLQNTKVAVRRGIIAPYLQYQIKARNEGYFFPPLPLAWARSEAATDFSFFVLFGFLKIADALVAIFADVCFLFIKLNLTDLKTSNPF
jgi:hypothetical protein